MSEQPVWTEERRELWRRLSEHDFGTAGCDLDFATRLAREHGWTADYARGAIEEYRRFCFLSIAAGHMVTPSDAVDEVWHLHLTYTHDYWDRYCPDVLGARLHHEPTRGGRAEAGKHRDQYARTLAAYQAWFGAPPEAYWPHVSRAFGAGSAYRRVDLNQAFVLSRPRLPSLRQWGYAAAALALLAVAPLLHAQALGPLDWDGPTFLSLYMGIFVFACWLSNLLRRRMRETGATTNAINLDPWQTAFLAGGEARTVDAGIAELLARNLGEINKGDVRIEQTPGLEPPLDAIARGARVPVRFGLLVKQVAPALERLRSTLEQRGLLLTRAQSFQISLLSSLPFAFLVVFGVIKIMIGISRDRPVIFLVLLVILNAVIAGALLFKRPVRSLAGDAVLATLRQKHAYATRAPQGGNVGLAVALAGTAVLAGTAYADYHDARRPANGSDSSSSGCSSSCSSSDGGGGDSGGGGCGGCGGD